MTIKTTGRWLAATLAAVAVRAGAEPTLDSAFSSARAALAATAPLKAAAAAPAAGAGQISYDALAQSFSGAAKTSSLDSLVGPWIEVARALSPDQPGTYDPAGIQDGWLVGNVVGLVGKVIPARPPLQPQASYAVAWGLFPSNGAAFSEDSSLSLSFNGAGGYQDVPGHDEDDPVTCTNCNDGGPTTHWVEEAFYEFRVIGPARDYLIEKKTVGGTYDAGKGAMTGGRAYYFGFRRPTPAAPTR